MAIFTIDWQEMPPEAVRGGALAVGNFDGVHRGHAALLGALAVQARVHAGPAVALTFEPHPLELLRPGQAPPALTTPAERARLLHDLGADHVVTLRVTPELLRLSPEQFFTEVIRGRFGVRAMVEGLNFGFGRGRAGTVETLGRLCGEAKISLKIVAPVQLDGGEVSSSRVRAALQSGGVEAAERLLGRPYRLVGTVGVGQRRGATLGFPTANLTDLKTVAPGDGVYAARARHAAGHAEATWPAAVNVGPNPTFGENARKVEVHLIGFQGDLYGRSLAVDFVSRLRDTRPFGSATELVEQLGRDVQAARQAAGPAV
jgi:riboflavin kinase / FMN adenylyltransferase